jgi:hypothetical protein
MRRAIALGLGVVGLALGAGIADAASPGQIFGKWVETGPNGTEMITEFTGTTISSYGLDQFGKRIGNTSRFAVTYKDIDPSTIQVDTSAGDKILLHIRDADMIDMEFPGVGTHTMTRDNP